MAFSDRFTDRLRFPILLAVVTLLLLPLPALAQISVLPTQGKSLCSASAPEPGKWDDQTVSSLETPQAQRGAV